MTDDDVTALMPVAAQLSCAVTDYDPETVAEILTGLTLVELYGLAVLFAAHVDVDQPLVLQEEGLQIRRVAVAGASRAFTVPEHKILSGARDRTAARARAVAMTVCHRAGMSLTAVGRAFDRDHTTVGHAVRKVDDDTVLSTLADSIADRLPLAVMAG